MLFMLEWSNGSAGGVQANNNTLQATFDLPRTFAFAKVRVASNASERGR